MRSMRTLAGLLLGLALCQSAAAALPKAGQEAPDFTLKSGAGPNVRLRELRGEVVLINFWASWCGPCREEMPMLDQLYRRYAKAGFTLLGVNIDDDTDAARSMARKLGVSFPILFDAEKRASRLYDVDTMPATLILDRRGQVRHVHRGYRPDYDEQYATEIKELLKE